MTPLLLGGPQEDRRRAGTENVAGILSMMAALELREDELTPSAPEEAGSAMAIRQLTCLPSPTASGPTEPAAVRRRRMWRVQFERGLLDALPGAEIVGAGLPRLWNIVSAVMPAVGCQSRWVVKLDKLGFAVSTDSACSSGRDVPSHVLSAMGYAPAQASRVLRFSAGWETREADWDALLAAAKKVNGRAPRRSAQ